MELIVGLDVGLDVALDVGRFGGDLVTVGGHQGGKTAKNGLVNGTGTASGGTGSASNTSWLTGVLGATGNSFGWYGHSLARGGTLSGNSGDGSFPGQDHSHSFSVGTTAQNISGDNETRPVNRGVKYIIKV